MKFTCICESVFFLQVFQKLFFILFQLRKLFNKFFLDDEQIRIKKYGTCVLPLYDPWDPTIAKYIKRNEPDPCNVTRVLYTELEDGFVRIVNTTYEPFCSFLQNNFFILQFFNEKSLLEVF